MEPRWLVDVSGEQRKISRVHNAFQHERLNQCEPEILLFRPCLVSNRPQQMPQPQPEHIRRFLNIPRDYFNLRQNITANSPLIQQTLLNVQTNLIEQKRLRQRLPRRPQPLIHLHPQITPRSDHLSNKPQHELRFHLQLLLLLYKSTLRNSLYTLLLHDHGARCKSLLLLTPLELCG